MNVCNNCKRRHFFRLASQCFAFTRLFTPQAVLVYCCNFIHLSNLESIVVILHLRYKCDGANWWYDGADAWYHDSWFKECVYTMAKIGYNLLGEVYNMSEACCNINVVRQQLVSIRESGGCTLYSFLTSPYLLSSIPPFMGIKTPASFCNIIFSHWWGPRIVSKRLNQVTQTSSCEFLA